MLRRILVIGSLLFLYVAESAAQLVVITNPKTGVSSLTRDEVVNIFLGRFRQFPSGISAQPADLPAAQPEKALFYRLLVNKDLAEINSYWARLIFSGRTVPPQQTVGNEDLLSFISKTPGAIGYMEKTKVDSRVKVVLDLVE
ncbi:MAG: hypothetical protein NTY41_04265 [Proteobacteria bacterium]|nr:hypothetical protein [Pseudomonadota bacterium]